MKDLFLFLEFFVPLFFFFLSFSLKEKSKKVVRRRCGFFLTAAALFAPLSPLVSLEAGGLLSAVFLLVLFFSLWRASTVPIRAKS